jgi:hypothetical protein
MTHPGLGDYYPEWLDNLADDVTLEGSVLKGPVRGAEPVRALLAYARTLYDYQDFDFAGPYGDGGFIEEYSAEVRGKPIATVVTIARNAAGQTQRIVVNHRPLDSLLLFSRLMAEKFAGTPYAALYARTAE